jgi:hypothetical protein
MMENCSHVMGPVEKEPKECPTQHKHVKVFPNEVIEHIVVIVVKQQTLCNRVRVVAHNDIFKT